MTVCPDYDVAYKQDVLQKLNITLRKPLDQINFVANGGKFLQLEDIESFGPTVKDYHTLSLPVIDKNDASPFVLNYVLMNARKLDAMGRRSKWNFKGGKERETASQIYTVAQ